MKEYKMTCFHPITAWQNPEARLDIPSNDYYALKKVNFHETPGRIKIEIPCGHCLGCRLDHANIWATRISMEAKCWKKCCFVTLTYNDKHLPKNKNGDKTLVKKDLQDFLKRLRYYHKGIEEWEHPLKHIKENPIRYFACGEYGMSETGTHRPHYHLAIFNWEPTDLERYKQNKHGDWNFKSKELQKIWGKGFIVIEELNYNTASYIARYVQKKAGLLPEPRMYTGEIVPEEKIDERNGQPFTHYIHKTAKPIKEIQPEFITMSRGVGIGRMFYEKHKEEVKRNGGIFLKIKDKVHKKPIPKYFQKLWEKEDYEEYYRFKYEQSKRGLKRKVEIISRIKMPDGTTDEEKWSFYLNQTERQLMQKASKYLKRENMT